MPVLLAIMGPTASGKTELAEALAETIGADLLNADAFQVYRGIDIGTAKPHDRDRYRLLDLVDPDQPFGVGEWTRMAVRELEELYRAGRSAIVVGGTGLYIRALFEEYSEMRAPPDPALRARLNATPIETLRSRLIELRPDLAMTVDLANPVRVRRALERLEAPLAEPLHLPPFRKLKLALNPPQGKLEERIIYRIFEMVQNGLTQEIEGLRRQGFRRDDPGFRAIGYRPFWDVIEGKLSPEEATATTIVDTRRYIKRQRTWLRTEPNLIEISATAEGGALQEALERFESVLM